VDRLNARPLLCAREGAYTRRVPKRNVPFTIRDSGFTVVEVIDENGIKYQISLKLAIMKVEEAGVINPVTNMPQFDFQATVVAEQKVVSEESPQ
jgi:hypothetical protein